MHRAFDYTTVVNNLPLTITELATWGERLMVCGTSSQGENDLLLYYLKYSSEQCEYELEQTFKKFTTKPVTQVALVTEHNLLLMLADGEILIVNLEDFQVTERIPKTKGVVCFAVDWQILRSGGQEAYLRICVAAKRKLLFLYLQDKSFVTLQQELSLPQTPVSISWNANGLIACMKKEYYHVSLHGPVKKLFPIGQNRKEPEMLPLMENKILLLKDAVQIILDENLRPSQSHVTNWSKPPNGIILIHPFLIALLPKCVEVRALDRQLLLQSIPDVKGTKYHAIGKHIFVANNHNVFKLTPVTYDIQVPHLIQQGHYELALQTCELSPENNKHKMKEIQRLYAFNLFTQHNFEKSVQIYTEIDADPVEVIGLYKDLIPSEFDSLLSGLYLREPPLLEGEALIRATKCLIDYLNQLRLSKDEHSISSEDIRAQLIDITLLKCYVRISSPLISSFIRLRGKVVHLAESECVLITHKRYIELVELYNVKGHHDKALKLLLDYLSQDMYSPSAGTKHIIKYLQELGPSELQLIFEYSTWVFNKVEKPMDALRIFTEDIDKIKSLPRQEVVKHLMKNEPRLLVPYLEHIVHHWLDPTPIFHNFLIKNYKDKVEKLLKQYRQTMAGKVQVRAGQEPGELGKIRSKLLKFLEESQHYIPTKLISSFPSDDLFEERALLLCRLGRHEVALAIYAHVIKEPEIAEEYCRKNYDLDKIDSREVYLSLLKMYLSPPNMDDYGISLPGGVKPEPNFNAALRVLTIQPDLIYTVKISVGEDNEYFYKQLQQKDHQILQKDQQIHQKEQELHEKDCEIHRNVQEIHKKHQELNQRDQEICQKTHDVQQKDQKIQQKDQQIQQKDQQIQQKDQQIQKKDQELFQLNQQMHQQLFEKDQQIHQLQQSNHSLPQSLNQQSESTDWVIQRCETTILEKFLGKGGWGVVKEATFRGCKVAAKCLHNEIISAYNLGLFSREMKMAARCRHPNILQFIGATNQGLPIIVTELMHTSLRKILEQGQLYSNQIIPISLGVAYGLNYLHKTTPDPILHRDVSSANVLLNPLPNNQWHPKLSDFGSTNFVRASSTINAGNPTYASPEANQGKHSTAMDVFSYGVLMFEMCSRELPAAPPEQFRLHQVRWGATENMLRNSIWSCLVIEARQRPDMDYLINQLLHISQ